MSFTKISNLKGHKDQVLSCRFCGNNQELLVSGGEDGVVCVFDVQSTKLVNKIVVPQSEGIPCVLPYSDKALLYLCSGSSIYSTDTRFCGSDVFLEKYENVCDDEINSLDVNNGGDLLISTDDSGKVSIFRCENMEKIASLQTDQVHSNIASKALFLNNVSSNEQFAISGGLDGRVVLWDVNNQQNTQHYNMQELLTQIGEGQNQIVNPPFVHSIQLLSSHPCEDQGISQIAATGLGNGQIGLFNLNLQHYTNEKNDSVENKLESEFLGALGGQNCGHSQPVSDLLFLENVDVNFLLSGGQDGKLILWNWTSEVLDGGGEEGEEEEEEEIGIQDVLVSFEHKRKINCLAYGGGNKFVVGDTGKQLKIYELR